MLHAHVKAPAVSVHVASASQLWDPSAIEGRGPSALQPRQRVSGPFSIPKRVRSIYYRSQYRMLNDPGIDGFPIDLFAKRATSRRESGRGRERTFAFVDRSQSRTKGVSVEDLFQRIRISMKSKSDLVGGGSCYRQEGLCSTKTSCIPLVFRAG